MPPEQVFKTLLTTGGPGSYVFAVIPGDAELDFKKLARAAGLRKAEMVPLKEVQPLTGYIRGGVTVFGAKKPYPVFADETIILFDQISVSAGARGTQLLLAPDDYLRAAEAQTADLTKDFQPADSPVAPLSTGAPSMRHPFGAWVGEHEANHPTTSRATTSRGKKP
jgi:Cys-tRNA(Pro)/Cys-tRNA(Cys) deacylase